jgi:flavorubredoxin
MWHSTAEIASHISDSIAASGTDVFLADLAETPVSKITTELLEARGLILGSPALHHGMLFRVAGYLQYLAGLKPKGKVAGVFGSYGWSSGATKQMTERLTEIGFEMPYADFTWKYRATPEDFSAAEEWAAQFAQWSRDAG